MPSRKDRCERDSCERSTDAAEVAAWKPPRELECDAPAEEAAVEENEGELPPVDEAAAAELAPEAEAPDIERSSPKRVAFSGMLNFSEQKVK